MSAATPAADNSLRSDATVISLVGFAHGTSHFFHFVLPPLFPWLMREFGLTFTQVGAGIDVDAASFTYDGGVGAHFRLSERLFFEPGVHYSGKHRTKDASGA